jgi:general stress protein YciG
MIGDTWNQRSLIMPDREHSQTRKHGMDEQPRSDATVGQTHRPEDDHPKERAAGTETGGPYKKDRDTEIAVEAGRKGRQQSVKR